MYGHFQFLIQRKSAYFRQICIQLQVLLFCENLLKNYVESKSTSSCSKHRDPVCILSNNSRSSKAAMHHINRHAPIQSVYQLHESVCYVLDLTYVQLQDTPHTHSICDIDIGVVQDQPHRCSCARGCSAVTLWAVKRFVAISLLCVTPCLPIGQMEPPVSSVLTSAHRIAFSLAHTHTHSKRIRGGCMWVPSTCRNAIYYCFDRQAGGLVSEP